MDSRFQNYLATIAETSSKTTLQYKLATLQTIGGIEFHWLNLIEDIAWAILIVLIGYGITVGTRSISMFVEFGIMPAVTKKIIDKNVVTRTEHEEVVKERDEYAEKYEKERGNGRILSKDYDLQLEEIKHKNTTITEQNDQITKLNGDVQDLNSKLSAENEKISKLEDALLDKDKRIKSIEDEFNELTQIDEHNSHRLKEYHKLLFDNKNIHYWESIEKFPPTIEHMVEALKSAGMWNKFMDVVNFETHGGSIDSNSFESLVPYGVISTDRGDRLNIFGKVIGKYMYSFNKH